jgi:hypothetical protein
MVFRDVGKLLPELKSALFCPKTFCRLKSPARMNPIASGQFAIRAFPCAIRVMMSKNVALVCIVESFLDIG